MIPLSQLTGRADSTGVIDGAIRMVAILVSLIVVAGFTLFAVDELSGASERQQTAVENQGCAPREPTRTQKPRSGVRKAFEDATGAVEPAQGAGADRQRVGQPRRPDAAGLLVYGLGPGFRYIRQRA
jgi:hypothetical protein